jgi:hypothetical protein
MRTVSIAHARARCRGLRIIAGAGGVPSAPRLVVGAVECNGVTHVRALEPEFASFIDEPIAPELVAYFEQLLPVAEVP